MKNPNTIFFLGEATSYTEGEWFVFGFVSRYFEKIFPWAWSRKSWIEKIWKRVKKLFIIQRFRVVSVYKATDWYSVQESSSLKLPWMCLKVIYQSRECERQAKSRFTLFSDTLDIIRKKKLFSNMRFSCQSVFPLDRFEVSVTSWNAHFTVYKSAIGLALRLFFKYTWHRATAVSLDIFLEILSFSD